MGLQPGWATASLIGAAASVVVCLLLCLFMCVCYYPGGRKFSDVIAIHEISKYNPSGKEMDGDEDYDVESQSEYGTIASAVEHKDQRLGSRVVAVEDLPIRRGPQMMEI